MMKKLIFCLTAMLLVMACSVKTKSPEMGMMPKHENEPGDSTRYGLACDGTSDSLLILLPIEGGDPDTFYIIRASHEHQIFGRPHIGDELAVILNPDDTTEARKVINIERLKGDWRYQVTPTFRRLDSLPEKIRNIRMAQIPDSVKSRLLVPKEYGISLKRGHLAQTIGSRRNRNTDEMSPVEYPKVRHYAYWKLFNGKLILETDTTRLSEQAEKKTLNYDTVEIVLLRRDSLVLRFKDHEQAFYRKKKDSIK